MILTRRVAAVALLAILGVTAGCSSEEGSSGSTPVANADPATLDGSCGLLIGPEAALVDDALAAGKAVVDGGQADQVADVQNKLFELVAGGSAEIHDPAGTLVDYLDDPSAYTTDDKVSSTITDVVDQIKQACKDDTGDISGY